MPRILGTLSGDTLDASPAVPTVIKEADDPAYIKTLDQAKRQNEIMSVGFAAFFAVGVGLFAWMLIDDKREWKRRQASDRAYYASKRR